ncbi:MAG: NAD(P)H-dependent oxidoreductase [Actinomyces sp.]|uniref:FMN dependent NADH:quinone oxidoreductase n=1 Tax=Schaalia naturae TaxID=635203 RepID=A0ABW2SHW8_9ACTO|nr:NAD(P)H-dependent oxidoreductase [Actinomyces sp.]MCI1642390.1 NAD(P)H-dependent oxidoreductase [Actinomyces sp.]MCI1662952.1 NAD(P)H-dependent oxidoreductase [Actinomyces sp.]MCI1691546.1 NAD(P)H-dependent oxidoreductase [Actinomyces sp.]MCI1787160.1 NAD(P)H-dependent oxidoreductase [Actinomyces sp.]MCI1829554.1 NAD(P)H-dependent oxidoreductase [Actinomyces sp.]
MARVLVVRAHPLNAQASRTMRLADGFVRAYRAANPDDEISDLRLYNVAVPEIDLDLLNGWRELSAGTPFVHLNLNEQAKITLFNNYTDQFMAADKLVIANPLWNLQVPTRLKAWLDTTCVAGTSFRYTDTGASEGLVHDKKALHIQTSGGVFAHRDPASVYVRSLLQFLGITDVTDISAEGMDHDPEHAEDILDDAMRRLVAFARTF